MSSKVSGPNLVTQLNQTPMLEWFVIRCGFMNGHPKTMCLRDWTTGSKYVNCSWLKIQHNWGSYMII